MPKRGSLNKSERKIISDNPTMSVEELSRLLDRPVETVKKFMVECGLQAAKTPNERSEDLEDSEKWKRLQQELTSSEVRFFKEEYARMMGQFRGDVLASEVTQIFDLIRFEILKGRNMIDRRRAIEEISRLEISLDRLTSSLDEDAISEEDKVKIGAMKIQLIAARDSEQSRSSEYVKFQERHDSLMKSLKSTRDQRIREIESGKETILGLLKMLQRKEVEEYEGRQMALMSMAADKEYNRLGELHEYEDGKLDRPILSPETVGVDEPEEVVPMPQAYEE